MSTGRGGCEPTARHSLLPALMAPTSVASWCRLACSMSMCQSPWKRRRLLSHQGRGGLGSSEGLVRRSTHWPIRVQAGSQQGPHTMVYWEISAGDTETSSAHVPHSPVPTPAQSSPVPPALTVEVVVELQGRHVPLHGGIPPGQPQLQDLAAPGASLAALLGSDQPARELPVPDLKEVAGVVANPHCGQRKG